MKSLNLLNTTIITSEGVFWNERISTEKAKSIVSRALGENLPITSFVGHEATAAVMEQILGIPVGVTRDQFSQAPGDDALCFKLRDRLPEGTILSLTELEAIGFDFCLIRQCPPQSFIAGVTQGSGEDVWIDIATAAHNAIIQAK